MENKTTVLIVDDEAAGRESIEGALYTEGYSLIFASGGKEAYEKAVEFLPDLILLDVMMPGTNGFEVCRMIRANKLVSEMPIVMVTALDDRQSRLAGLEAGADDFLNKPFDRVELRARVRTITRLNRYRSLILERVRFAWVVEQTSDGYVVLDEDDEILYANPAAQNFLNLPTDNEGLPFLDQIQKHFNLEPENNWAIWPAVQNQLLYLIQPETNTSQPVILNVEVLELPTGSKNKQLLRITNATQALALQREMWSFHTAISHKLKTPVSQLVMAAQLIKHRAATTDNEDMLELSDAMLTGAKRLEDEIKSVLQYLAISKLPNKNRSLPIEQLPAFIQNLCEELGIRSARFTGDPALRTRELRISWHAAEIIFRELLENAIKFHPRQSPTIQIDLTQPSPDLVCLRVADDGATLSQEQLSTVWQPYYQAEKSYSGEISGMGLGLASIANLVWEAGGKVRMMNRENQPGIIVELQLPLG